MLHSLNASVYILQSQTIVIYLLTLLTLTKLEIYVTNHVAYHTAQSFHQLQLGRCEMGVEIYSTESCIWAARNSKSQWCQPGRGARWRGCWRRDRSAGPSTARSSASASDSPACSSQSQHGRPRSDWTARNQSNQGLNRLRMDVSSDSTRKIFQSHGVM